MGHTILLIQSTSKPDSRTWSDYETVEQGLEAIRGIFEEHLKKVFPTDTHISYDVNDLLFFLDKLGDLTCMVFDETRQVYIPKSRDWIKSQLYVMIRRQATT